MSQSKKIIVIDCFSVENQKTGVSQYALELLKNIFKINNDEFKYIILTGKKLDNNHELIKIAAANNVEVRRYNIPAIGLRRDIKYFFLKRKIKYDLFHCLNSNLPFAINKNCAVTIHDLKFLKYPVYIGKFSFFKKIYLKNIFLHAVEKTSGIIAVSESTKNDLKTVFKKQESEINKKAKVIYSGVTFDTSTNVKIPETRQKYFLYLGELRPHKNINRLVKVFQIFIEKNKIEDLVLIIAGKMHKSMNIDILGLSKKIIFRGFVDDSERFPLYSNAEAFFFPSLYEGFGFPILEAMTAEVPVVTSNISSMPEVADDAAYLVDPFSENDLEKSMYEMYYNSGLKKELIKKGKERAKYFNWEKTAKETLEFYRAILNR